MLPTMFLTLFMVLFGLLIYHNHLQKNKIRAEKYEFLESISTLKTEIIDIWIKERKGEARFTHNNKHFSELIGLLVNDPLNEDLSEQVTEWLRPMQKNHDYSLISFVSAKGNKLIHLNGDTGIIPLQINLAREADSSLNILIADNLQGHHHDKLFIDMFVPVIDQEEGSLLGTVIFRIDPEAGLFPLLERLHISGQSLETILLKREGDEIVILNDLKYSPQTHPGTRSYSTVIEDFAGTTSLMEKEGTFTAKDYRGVQVLANIQKVNTFNWIIITKVDTEEVFEPLAVQRNQFIMTIFLFAASVAITVFFMIQSRKNKFYKEIYRKERDKKAMLRHFEYLKKHANDPIFLINPDGSIIDVNQRALQTYGYSEEEMLRMEVNDIRAPGKRHEIDSQLKTVIEFKGHVFETLHIKKDKTVFPVEVSARYIEVEGTHYFHSIVRDISDRKLAEKKIRELDAHIRIILESVGEGIIELNTKGEITYVNESGALMLGFKPCELLGKESHKSFHHKKPGDLQNEHGECLIIKSINSRKRLKTTKDYFVSKNGTYIPVEYTTDPIIKEGQFKGCVLVYRDISEKQMAEEHIILAKEIAEESSKLKSAILMNMSHELRTPLNGILGFAQLLQRKMKDTPEATMVDRIVVSGDRLLSTLTNILELAQLESGQPQVTLSRYSLKSIIPEITARYELIAEKKNLFFLNNVDNDYMVYTDIGMLMESLSHIIDNAIKFTTSGGIIISADQIEKNGNLFSRLHVKDTGIGIPEKDVKNIFMEFHQLSQGCKRNYEGTGIGLSLVLKMIVLIKGNISVKSEPGKGSVFTITLPSGIEHGRGVIPAPGNYSGYNNFTIPSKIEPQKILVIEDNYINSQLISAYLEDLVILEHATDGKTALKMAVEKNYDIVLMDIKPGTNIDGLDTTTRLRRIPGYEETPIVAVTGYNLKSDREKILKQGCDYFIGEPFSEEKLKSLIRKIVNNYDR